MARPDKAAAVAELTEHFRGSSAALLTEYRGLTVKQLTELRHALGNDTTYAVAKNTLTKIAAKKAGVDDLDHLLEGPTAIAFVKGDPVLAAKGIRDFAKANPALVVKGGVLDGRPLSAADLTKLADVEPREVLLTKLAGAMIASLSQAAALFQAPLSQAARVVEALRAKLEAESPAGAPVSQDAADEPSNAEADVVEVAAEAVAEAAAEPAAETADSVEPEPAGSVEPKPSDAATSDAAQV